MDDTKILKSRLTDLATKAYNQNIYTYSGFLNGSELAVLYSMREELGFIPYSLNGGYELAERAMVRFGSEELFGYDEPWRIAIIKAEPLIDKFADSLSHRDFLGALMNLGIERNVLGDVVIKDNKRAFIMCQDNMTEYIMENLNKVKHTNIKCSCIDINEDLNELKPELVDMNLVVAAARFDAIIAAAIKCSRQEALNLFKAMKVTLNGRCCTRNSMTLKPDDIFSIRGHGKFQFVGCGNETRKGRIYVHLKQYK